jgi:CubicO group peptidase (beta-lactamase class C family)
MSMRLLISASALVCLLIAACLSPSSAAAQPLPTDVQPAAPLVAPQAAPATAAASAAHPLTQDDVAAFMDGFLPFAFRRADIAGGVAVVVKDGKVLFERGYGLADVSAQRPVDPAATLFRIGSVSKLFTWTAVMQLVQAGRLDLDADVNTYLDFKIPPAFGKPITLRTLMTHSAGFSDVAKDLVLGPSEPVPALGDQLKRSIPERLYPPGTTPAYSNYGASLAGYIVQRVSGEGFDDYVARHIFAPLGMAHTTFAQTLPPNLAALLSQGYKTAAGPPLPFERISLPPAGAVTASGDDMAHFMIAQLQDGAYGNARILDAATVRLMHSPQFQPVPPLPSMDLGFYQEPAAGHRVIGHEGDTDEFHTSLHLFLDDHVGLFISFNSFGTPGAIAAIRDGLFRAFTARYFPAPPEAEPTLATAAADGRTLAGYYVCSRRSDTGWLRVTAFLLGEANVTTTPAGIVSVSTLVGLADHPKQWREVAPFVYREVGGVSRMAAVVDHGRVLALTSDDIPPVLEWQPVSLGMSNSWNKPLFYATLVVLVAAAVLWPAVGIARWRYRQGAAFPGRMRLWYRLARIGALAELGFFAGWVVLFTVANTHIEVINSDHAWLLRLIQLAGVLGLLGAVAAVVFAVRAFSFAGRGAWWTRLSASLVAAALLACVWFSFSQHLLTAHLRY